ncbi:hypothetical protein [Nitrospirillum iridis]|uniref:TIR domain-containing protein n=1 Tax=Nitrospirillum iridis TaxID=765888 RepID=A0A7X0B3S7_9PROT|nr:hypothetical protein [Nitrospirillum iridis]MBB6255215.1 hypothetical protein [Nitrospirillum iridis]
MAQRDDSLFLFISHANDDKDAPKFCALLERLHEAGIPMGIDRPGKIKDLTIKSTDFVWGLDGSNEDWLQHLTRAMAEGACGIVVVASPNTNDVATPAKKRSKVWDEVLVARTLQATINPNLGFFLIALEPGAHATAPAALRNSTFMDAVDELDGEIARMRAHVEGERRRRAERSSARQLVNLAMRALIRDKGVLLLFGGTRVPLDAVYTPLRGDALTASERQAAQDELLDPDRELIHLQGPGAFEDRITRLTAARAAHILPHPVMPGMPQGLAAALDPFAVAGGTTKLSDLIASHGHVIILGEPAAGKTTLLNWLALRFAEAWAASEDPLQQELSVQALKSHVDPTARHDEKDEEVDNYVSLGPLRLPIHLPVPELSANIQIHGASDLVTFLAMRLACQIDHIAFPDRETIAHQVVVETLAKGRLLVLLDGLDEIDEHHRPDTIALIEQFAELYTSADPDAQPGRANRLLVTSRIVGYHALPLSAQWPHVVVDRMTPAVVLDFWTRLYRSEAFGEVEAPQARAQSLHEKVYARHRSSVADLAGIPLLATLLARVFEENEQFPDHRAQIYDRALVSMLKEQRKTDMDLGFLYQWLAPLAYDLHGKSGPALIEEAALITKMRDRLRTIEPSFASDRERTKFVQDFLDENGKRLGLLVKRSPEIWAFVHRTFQEYFAGLWLAEVTLQGGLGLSQLTEPRWREPLLLLLGSSFYAGAEKVVERDALFNMLLNAATEPVGQARIGRLLAEALGEMPDLPSDAILARVVRSMLSDLVAGDWNAIPAYARARTVAALYAFGRRDADRLEQSLISLLEEGPAAFSRIVARIILDRHWCSFELEVALGRAEQFDCAAEQFPILQALQQVRSETVHGELGGSAKMMAMDRQMEANRKNALDGLRHLARAPYPGETVYQVVRRRAERGRYAYINRFNLFDEEVDGRLKRASGARSGPTSLSGAEYVPIDLNCWGDMRALAEVTLGRGFEYRGRLATLIEYRRFLQFINFNDAARHTALEYFPEFRMMFGADDPIYYLAVNLDLFFAPTFKDVAPPYLMPPSGGQTAPLPANVEAFLRSSGGWFDRMRQAVWRFLSRQRMTARDYAASILCEALADIMGRKSAYDLIGFANDEQRRALVLLLQSILASGLDGVLHAGQHLAAHFQALAATDEQSAIQALATVSEFIPQAPLCVSDAVDHSHPRAFAERLAYRLLGFDDNYRQYSAAVALDAQTGLPTATLLPILQALSESVTLAWARSRLGLGTALPWPIDQDRNEFTLAVFDMAAVFDAGDDMSLRSAQASTLFDRLRAQSKLQAASLAPYASLPRSVLTWSMGIEEAGELVANSDDPYHQARYALGMVEAMHWADGIDQAAALLERIDSPVLRLDIAERLAKLASRDAAPGFRTAALGAARSIVEPSQRWRGLLRLAAQPNYPAQDLEREAVLAIDAIADPAQQRADAASFHRLFARERRRKGKAFPSLSSRTIPAGLRNARLASCIRPDMTGHGDAGVILYIAQTCADLLEGLAGSGHDAPPQTLKISDLTVEMADLLLEMARAEQRVGICPSPSVARAKEMRIQTSFSLFACERWLDNPSHPLAWIAALAIVKTRARRDRRVLEPLLQALRSDDEDLAAQATCMLSRGRLLMKRERPDTNFDDVGFETLLWLGQRGVDPANADIRVLLACMVMDIEFHGATPIEQLFEHMDEVPEDQAAITFLLDCLTWTNMEAMHALADRMKGRAPQLQAGFILALGGLDLSQRVEEKQLDAPSGEKRPVTYVRPISADKLASLISALGSTNDTAPFRIFPDGGASLCMLIESVIAQERQPERRVAAFKLALEMARIDIRDTMSKAETSYDAMDRFLSAKTQLAGQAHPYRHNHFACHELRNRVGSDAVRLASELLVELTRFPCPDYELAGLVATLCFEYALVTPSLVASALKSHLGGEAELMKFLAAIIDAPPRGVSHTTVISLACLLRHLDEGCVKSLITVSGRPDLGNWVLVEQSLLGVGRVEAATLPLILEALTSARPRTVLLAIRLLGILARDAGAEIATRRAARLALENFDTSPVATHSLHLFMPSTQINDEGCIVSCGTLTNVAATELFFADGAQS